MLTNDEARAAAFAEGDRVSLAVPGWPVVSATVLFVKGEWVTVLVDGYAASNDVKAEHLTLLPA